MFGKVMSINDNLIVKYFKYFTRVPEDEFKFAYSNKSNPRDYKMKLAHEIVRMYHGDKAAKDAESNFISIFSKKEKPVDMQELKPSAPDILTVLVEAAFATSRSDARRAVEQGGVRINDQKVSGITATVKTGDVVQKGSRFFVKIV
jgi:tyrosyl-tRNA synthetase